MLNRPDACPPLAREPLKTLPLLVGAGFLLVMAAAAMSVDVPLARWFNLGPLPGDLRRVIGLSEVFAHGFGVAVAMLLVTILDPASRRSLPRVLLGVAGTGLWVNVIKVLVGRLRPRALDWDAPGETFLGWLTWLGSEQWTFFSSDIQSFPSGHTATAASLALALTWLYPRGWWLFATFAVLGAVQRLDSGAHYLSDTLVGAAVALAWTSVCMHPRLLGRWLTRWEQGIAKSGSEPPKVVASRSSR